MEPIFNESKISHFLKIDIPNSYKDGTNFTCELFRLLRKADPFNQHKLGTVYPDEFEAWQRFERISLSQNCEQLPDVGSIVKTGRKVMSAEAGTLGIVYEQYAIGSDEPTSVSILFENGDYDEFNREDLKLCQITHTGRLDRYCQYYCCENVGQLMEDFNKGLFNRAFINNPGT